MDPFSVSVPPLIEEELDPVNNSWDSDRAHHGKVIIENVGMSH